MHQSNCAISNAYPFNVCPSRKDECTFHLSVRVRTFYKSNCDPCACTSNSPPACIPFPPWTFLYLLLSGRANQTTFLNGKSKWAQGNLSQLKEYSIWHRNFVRFLTLPYSLPLVHILTAYLTICLSCMFYFPIDFTSCDYLVDLPLHLPLTERW